MRLGKVTPLQGFPHLRFGSLKLQLELILLTELNEFVISSIVAVMCDGCVHSGRLQTSGGNLEGVVTLRELVELLEVFLGFREVWERSLKLFAVLSLDFEPLSIPPFELIAVLELFVHLSEVPLHHREIGLLEVAEEDVVIALGTVGLLTLALSSLEPLMIMLSLHMLPPDLVVVPIPDLLVGILDHQLHEVGLLVLCLLWLSLGASAKAGV